MDLHSAVERGKMSEVRNYIDSNLSQLNVRDHLNNQPLHIAAWHNKKKVAEYLIDAGADINAKGDQGRTPLYYAIENGAVSIAKLLMDRGADVNIRSDLGANPLYLAASQADKKTVAMLTKRGAVPDLYSKVYISGPDAVLAELKANASLLDKEIDPVNLLWDAIQVDSTPLARFLLDNGANPNRKAWGRHSLLHYAISHNLSDIVDLLIEHGVDLKVRDHIGRSLLAFCDIYHPNPRIVEMLQSHGAE